MKIVVQYPEVEKNSKSFNVAKPSVIEYGNPHPATKQI